MASYESALQVEQRSIDFIPEDERHGRTAGLFAIWFASNMQVTTAVTGALGVVLGLPLPWALLALLIGNAFGAVFMALHSAQGPKLSLISALGFAYLLVRLIQDNDVGAVWHGGSVSAGTFLLVVAIAATWRPWTTPGTSGRPAASAT